jgi:hypothetical protein
MEADFLFVVVAAADDPICASFMTVDLKNIAKTLTISFTQNSSCYFYISELVMLFYVIF